MDKKDTIVITGAAGFIGRNLCVHFAKLGKRLIAIDRIQRYKIQEPLKGILQSQPHEYYCLNLEKESNPGILKQQAETLIHLAAEASVKRSLQKPKQTILNNVLSFHTAIDIAKYSGVTKFFYASSSNVYGSFSEVDNIETQELAPMNPYGLSKVLNEVQAQYCGIKTTGLRFFNVYGPVMNREKEYSSVLQTWMEACKNGQPIVIYGDGTKRRDFTHIDDVVQAIEHMINGEPKAPIYNIAYGNQTSIIQVAKMLKDILGERCKSEIEFRADRDGEIKTSGGDIGLLLRDIGFEPRIGIKEGLEMLVKEYGL